MEFGKNINSIVLPEAQRDDFLKKATIDVVKRQEGNGQYSIDLIVYVAPGYNPNHVEQAFRMACIDIYGHRPPDWIELGYLSPHDGWGLEAGGSRDVVSHSFNIKIKWPRSSMTNMFALKEQFMERIYNHMKE